jgi:hypothetical protein
VKYIIVFNDDERVANGDDVYPEDVKEDVVELLRSGYYEVETFVAGETHE